MGATKQYLLEQAENRAIFCECCGAADTDGDSCHRCNEWMCRDCWPEHAFDCEMEHTEND
jgi:hypothetical protein